MATLERMPNFIAAPFYKLRFRLRTLRNLYAIRRAYHVPLFFVPKAAAALSFLSLFLLFGAVFLGRFVNRTGSAAIASVASRLPKPPGPIAPEIGDPGLPAGVVPHAFLVDKRRKRMIIFKADRGGWIAQDEFTIILGESPGRKQTEGDKRTPEGLYWIIGERGASELDTAVYGSHAYILNYPNRFDRREGRGGSGIWIHGTDRPVSRGCVAMTKADLDKIACCAKIGIPVYIASEIEEADFGRFVPPEALLAERDSALGSPERLRESACEFVRDWARAWQSADIAAYRAFYSPDRFEAKGMGYEDYMRYKEGLFAALGRGLRVEVRDVSALPRDSLRMDVRFQQLYQTTTQSSYSTKTLKLVRRSEGWRIIGEFVMTN